MLQVVLQHHWFRVFQEQKETGSFEEQNSAAGWVKLTAVGLAAVAVVGYTLVADAFERAYKQIELVQMTDLSSAVIEAVKENLERPATAALTEAKA